MMFVTSAQGIEEAFESKKIASLIGLESGENNCFDLSNISIKCPNLSNVA